MTSSAARLPGTGTTLAVALAAVVVGLAMGGLASLGNPIVTLIVAGLLIAAAGVTSRNAVFWVVVIGALVVTGVAQLYLPGSRIVRYVVPVASLALLLHWWFDGLAGRTRPLDEPVPPPLLWGLAFVAVALASTLLNFDSPGVRLLGIKNYFQMWPLFIGFALLRWDQGLARSLAQAALLLGLLQLPFAAHEYLYLVPRRYGLGGQVVPVDIVAGTFGGDLLGGGANAVLAAFQVIVVGGLLAFWKNGLLRGDLAVVLAAVLLSPLLVNEAKIAALYLPLVFVILFRRDIVERPLRFVGAVAVLAVLLGTLMTALAVNNPTGRLNSWSDLVEQTIKRQTASAAEREGQYNELTRLTALTFWAREHVDAPPLKTLFGHGPAASFEFQGSVVDTADTLARKRYPGMRIGYTGLSALLWDTGVFGVAAVLGMYFAAFVAAGRLARCWRTQDPRRAALLEAAQAAIAVLALSLAHKDFFVINLPYQALTFLVLGYVANAWLDWRRQGQPAPV
jgi:hypothetical protein